MGKSKREVILDFTPLLDVMMLILFFFILFANTNYQNKIEEANANAQSKIEEANANAQSKIEEAEEAKEEAQSKIDTYNEKIDDVEAELNALHNIGNSEGESIDSLYKYEQGLYLKLYLKRIEITNKDTSEKIWNIYIHYNNVKIGTITNIRKDNIEDATNKLLSILSENGFDKDNNIMCELIIDSSEPDSYNSTKNTNEILKMIEKDYPHFFTPKTPTDVDTYTSIK